MDQPPALDRAPRGVTIGVDVGGSNVRAARIGRDGRMSGLRKVRTDSMPSLLDLVEALVGRLMSDDVVAVGIGIPGRLDRDGRTVLSAGFVNLADIPLGEILSARIARPVILDNDAHMALVAELARPVPPGPRRRGGPLRLSVAPPGGPPPRPDATKARSRG